MMCRCLGKFKMNKWIKLIISIILLLSGTFLTILGAIIIIKNLPEKISYIGFLPMVGGTAVLTLCNYFTKKEK